MIDLRAMLAPEMAACGLEYLRQRNGGASSVQISNLADFLPTLAARLDLPADVVAKLRRMKKKLKVTQHGMTERNREALRAFDDPAAVEALLGLPQRILRRGSGERPQRLSGSQADPDRAGDRTAAQCAGAHPEPRLDRSRAGTCCRSARAASASCICGFERQR